MSKKFRGRMNELIRSHVCTLIETRMNDPRVAGVTVTDVTVSEDTHYATVYFSVFGEEEDKQKALRGLESASGWLSRELGVQLRTKHTPIINFKYDNSLERGEHMSQVLDRVKQDDNERT